MTRLKPLIDWSPNRYDRLSKNYDKYARWFFPVGNKGREKVLSDLSRGRILDVACGTGTLLDKTEKAGLFCVGIDTSRGMLNESRRKAPTAMLVQASFYALPFAKETFNYVVETNAVSGVGIDAKNVLSEMLRACQQGGEIRIGDYGRANRKTFLRSLLEKIGILVGDYPHDYSELFESLGYQPEIEDIAWGGMYKYIKVTK